MKATVKKRTARTAKKKYEKMPIGNLTAEDIYKSHGITLADRRRVQAALDVVRKRRSATK